MRAALQLLRPAGPAMVLALLLAALATLAGVGLNAAGGALLAGAAQHPATLLSLGLLITGVRALGLTRATARYAERLVSHRLALGQLSRLRARLYRQLMPLGRELLVQTRTGDLLDASAADTDRLQDATLRVLLPLSSFLLLTGAVCLSLSALSWPLAGAVLLLLLMSGLTPLLLAPLSAGIVVRRDQARAAYAGDLLEDLAARTDLAAGPPSGTLQQSSRQLGRAERQAGWLGAGYTLLRELSTLTALLLTLAMIGTAPAVLLTAATLAVLTSFEAAAPLAGLGLTLSGLHGATRRVQALLALHPRVVPPDTHTPVPARPGYRLRAVGVQVGGQTLLEQAELTLPPGSRTGLIGESGAGKSSLLRLLTRDADPHSGEVSRDDVPLTHLHPGQLLARISVLDQDAALLDATLRDNLRLGDPEVPDERLRALLDRLGLHALSLDSWLGEGGLPLSGGERQRVALIRALLKPSDTLLLDEPTAHLDPQSEERAVQLIAEELRGRTLLLVTHRPRPLQLVNRVYRLQHARLVPEMWPAPSF
ncbi:amino acid ABC transporter ATP-binding/permease protein [Deinococcus sonorensis]|uniref:ATP-binding cassette domain-containing protein n=2 Tax=Deinococcus sonorensis TaxID=309891 RepID=A0AAU7U980_9DEIO